MMIATSSANQSKGNHLINQGKLGRKLFFPIIENLAEFFDHGVNVVEIFYQKCVWSKFSTKTVFGRNFRGAYFRGLFFDHIWSKTTFSTTLLWSKNQELSLVVYHNKSSLPCIVRIILVA